MKKLILFLLLALSSNTHALPLNIVPKEGISFPNYIGGTAFYTVTNMTSSQRNGNFVKYLPPNVNQLATDGGVCGITFDLSPHGKPGDSCTLILTINGVVDSQDVNPHHHLYICFLGGMTCSGTKFPIDVKI